jgi:carbamoyltransferase
MIRLGIAQSHCSSACLMKDGAIVGLIQEERLTQRKNQVAFPKRAISELARDHLGGNVAAIDKVVFAEHRIDPYGIALDRYSDFSVADHVAEQRSLWWPKIYGGGLDTGAYWRSEYLSGRHRNLDHNHDLSFVETMDWEAVERHFSDVERPAAMLRHFGWNGATTTVDHHTCHAYYAAYGAPLTQRQRDDALVLTADAWGEGRNWSAWTIDAEGCLQPVASGADHTVARLYKFVTLILGMKPNEHEYKVMGLAPFGRTRKYVEEAEKVFFEALDFRDGRFVSDRPLKDSYFDLRDRLEGHRFDSIAAAAQNWTGRITAAWVQHWLKQTGKRVLCFSGGLSMNIKLNGDLLQLPDIDYLSVPASGGDESISAGACFFDSLEERGSKGESAIEPLKHVYLGAEAAVEGWDSRLDAAGDFEIRNNVGPNEIAALLAADVIVARCAGRAEFGARALGNRSIIANPENARNVEVINNAIKNRDFWMPFCPSILAEHAAGILENPKDVPAPYMTIGYESKTEWRERIRASLHGADFSARPQFVDRATNPEYWEIIEAFRRLTGIPVVLNTSLNLHGEPMNYTVADAVRTVAMSGLDCLALPGRQLLYKKRAAARVGAILGRAAA